MRSRLLLLIVATACFGGCAAAPMPESRPAEPRQALTLERLYESPDLSGPAPKNLQIAPDGSRVAFLRGSEDDRLVYDLWEFSVADRESRRLVAASELADVEQALSPEEEARRERQRTAALKGIVDYQFSDDARYLLFPLSGDLYLYDLLDRQSRRLVSSDAAEVDPKFSPDGKFVSFVRGSDLYVVSVSGGDVRRLTTSRSETITNGAAEFVAQEEMDRDTGYWWSPDSSKIAFLEVDESPIQVEERFEVLADRVEIVRQRYPATGTANATYRLGVISISDGQIDWMNIGNDDDIYVARVDWFPNGQHLAVQRQSRDQQTLDLLRVDLASGESESLITETSETWVDIFDDLSFLESREEFIWASQRDGYKHFYLYRNDGHLVRQLTSGPWEVSGDRNRRALMHVDETAGDYWFVATADGPTERHLYRSSLSESKAREPARVTTRPGWHEIQFANDGSFYVDFFSNVETPPNVQVANVSGERLGFIEENRLDETHPYSPYRTGYVRPEFGVLESEDGQNLHYYLLRPKSATESTQAPAIVMVYGGPHGPRVKNHWVSPFEQILVNAGFVVFSVDNRGTDFRGNAFDAPIYRAMGSVEVQDQAVGARYLQSLNFVDADRIGMFGWSYGGYMTLMCLMQTPDLYAAGVSGAPVTDWSLYDTHYTERYMSTPESNPEGYRNGSVFPYIEQLASPLLLMHGMADDNVLFTHSTSLMKALQDQGKQFELMTYPGSKHGLLRDPKAGLHAYHAIVGFFKKNLFRD